MLTSFFSHDDLSLAIQNYDVAGVSAILAVQPELADQFDSEDELPMSRLLEQRCSCPEVSHAVTAIANLLVEAGVDVNKPINTDGDTLLYVVVKQRYTELAIELVQRGADINALHRMYGVRTPVAMAIETGNVELFKWFFAQENVCLHEEHIAHAMRSHSPSMVQALLKYGVPLDYQNDKGCDLLFMAVMVMAVDIAEFLLQQGLDPNRRQANGRLPLNYAALIKNREMLTCLLKYKAEVNAAEGPDGRTALHNAASMNNLQGMSLLLDAGADINAKNNDGATPLHLAAESYHVEAVHLLVERGADLDKVNEKGRTPLAHATYRGAHKTAAALAYEYSLQDLKEYLNLRSVEHFARCTEPVFAKLEEIYNEKRRASTALDRLQLDNEAARRAFRSARIGLFHTCRDPISATMLPWDIHLKIARTQIETQHEACLRLNKAMTLL